MRQGFIQYSLQMLSMSDAVHTVQTATAVDVRRFLFIVHTPGLEVCQRLCTLMTVILNHFQHPGMHAVSCRTA
jgi:hypothetical protein